MLLKLTRCVIKHHTLAPNLTYSNIAREIWLDAGLDPTVPSFSTVMACSTSMAAALEAAGQLGRGGKELALVGGVESMSRVQIGLTQGLSDWLRRLSQARKPEDRLKRLADISLREVGLYVPSVKNRVTNKSMGEHCQEMAKRWNIAREAQDEIAYESHVRSVKARNEGFFDDLLITVDGTSQDAFPREGTSMEKLGSLRAAFDRESGNGTLTAGNSSPLTDGAAGLWVASDEGLKAIPEDVPRVKLIDWEFGAVDIEEEGLLMAPAYAIPRMLARQKLRYSDIGLWEIHEAFAAQVLCNIAALEDKKFLKEQVGVEAELGKFPRDRVNPNGGSALKRNELGKSRDGGVRRGAGERGWCAWVRRGAATRCRAKLSRESGAISRENRPAQGPPTESAIQARRDERGGKRRARRGRLSGQRAEPRTAASRCGLRPHPL